MTHVTPVTSISPHVALVRHQLGAVTAQTDLRFPESVLLTIRCKCSASGD